jgi:hypothetical protein
MDALCNQLPAKRRKKNNPPRPSIRSHGGAADLSWQKLIIAAHRLLMMGNKSSNGQ